VKHGATLTLPAVGRDANALFHVKLAAKFS